MDLFEAPFYWGRITRQDAEELLGQYGWKNGSYLVREKYEEAGAYAITLCFLKRYLLIRREIQREKYSCFIFSIEDFIIIESIVFRMIMSF